LVKFIAASCGAPHSSSKCDNVVADFGSGLGINNEEIHQGGRSYNQPFAPINSRVGDSGDISQFLEASRPITERLKSIRDDPWLLNECTSVGLDEIIDKSPSSGGIGIRTVSTSSLLSINEFWVVGEGDDDRIRVIVHLVLAGGISVDSLDDNGGPNNRS